MYKDFTYLSERKMQHFWSNFGIISSYTLVLTFLILCYFDVFDIYYQLSSFMNQTIRSEKDFMMFEVARKSCIIITFSALMLSLYSYFKEVVSKDTHWETPFLMILGTICALIITTAQDLIIIYLCFVVLSLIAQILLAHSKNKFELEAAIKYFIFDNCIGILFLLGVALIYLSHGNVSMYIHSIQHIENISHLNLPISTLENAGFTILLIYGCFKLGVPPLHFWVPDVLQSTKMEHSIYLLGILKVPICIMMIRILKAFPNSEHICQIMLWLGVFATFWSAVVNLQQSNIKRIFGYSSIHQTGFILIAISIPFGESASIIYANTYVILIHIPTMYLLSKLESISTDNNKYFLSIDSVKAFSSHSGYHQFLSCVLMLSVAGIPPLAGFFIKLNIFELLIQQSYYTALCMVFLSTVVAAFYPFRIISSLFFSEVMKTLAGLKHSVSVEYALAREFSIHVPSTKQHKHFTIDFRFCVIALFVLMNLMYIFSGTFDMEKYLPL
ncbi:proton-conducting transporter transmembrane domain-containing protein [Candidatus Fokinia crypta]|uniref:NADH-quinone oxidoreductase subunit N n=1 Tax=Candidatus Fokinia crypta TaxID=1920990 RepID=A0ABZ0USI7_9RICK|nr:proton-conducting transporter membrane subunit [Candidatus Fokinia cryptica]WPX97875.1 NADH-quinone oxidoreductase subunit N [Candidatus Fokinia cryptica]